MPRAVLRPTASLERLAVEVVKARESARKRVKVPEREPASELDGSRRVAALLERVLLPTREVEATLSPEPRS